MIETVRLYRDLVNTAKVGTSGFIREVEFNDALAAVQSSMIGTFAPLFANNRSVRDILAPFIKTSPVSGGVVAKPSDYEQLIGINVGDHPARLADLNEEAAMQSLPSRRPDSTNGVYYYIEAEDSFRILPSAGSADFSYIRTPGEALITLTATSTADSDYLTPTSSQNLEWPERAYNIIFYMMMERFGISQKEALLMEYANLGVRMEAEKL